MSAARTLMGLLIAIAFACGSPATSPPAKVAHPVSPPPNEAEPAAPTSAETPVSPSAAESSALPNCVMHAGLTEVKTTERGGPGGKKIGPIERKSECYYNAECVRQHGVLTPGDGIVRIHCEDHACVCRIEFMPPRESMHEFSFEGTCETHEQAEQLLKDRCIPARRLPEHPGPSKP